MVTLSRNDAHKIGSARAPRAVLRAHAEHNGVIRELSELTLIVRSDQPMDQKGRAADFQKLAIRNSPWDSMRGNILGGADTPQEKHDGD
jgi:hypothetical protein